MALPRRRPVSQRTLRKPIEARPEEGGLEAVAQRPLRAAIELLRPWPKRPAVLPFALGPELSMLRDTVVRNKEEPPSLLLVFKRRLAKQAPALAVAAPVDRLRR